MNQTCSHSPTRRFQYFIPVLNGSPCNLAALANGITYNWEHGGGRKGCSSYISTVKADKGVYSVGKLPNSGNKASYVVGIGKNVMFLYEEIYLPRTVI